MDILETPDGKPLRFETVEALYKAQLADIEDLYSDFNGPVVLLNFVPSARLSCLSIPQYFHLGRPPTDLELSKMFERMARSFIAQHPKFRLVDPADYLCSGQRCELVNEQGQLLYVDDSGHVARYAAWRIVPAIMGAIRSGLDAHATSTQ